MNLPFMSEQPAHVNGTRLIEALIIAAGTGFITSIASSYVTVAALRAELTSVKEQLVEMRARLTHIEGDVYRPAWPPVKPSGLVFRDPKADTFHETLQ